ncbi:DUF7373 family lipoprotein [Nocardia kruczakiae]|uniref:DUF7373 family lipoprotein n=1 Tax=Nocardia kruczakiae TaxID=261477 RepID=UPI0007A534D1|nr:hypothetical protein [Nocardia kruczakiae]
MRKISRSLLLTFATLITVVGCGDIKSGSPIAGEIDVRHLDTGQYPTEPIDTYQEYSHTVENGSALAEIRLMNHMVTGLDVDPTLKYGSGAQNLEKSWDFERVLSKAGAAAALRNKPMFGFASGSSDHEPDLTGQSIPSATLITLAIMQFPSSDSANRAAAEIEKADFDVAPDRNQSVHLGKYAEAHSHWQPGTPSIGSVVARGQYVVSTFAQTPDGKLDNLTALVEKTYDKQLPMLDSLSPLSAEQVLKLEPGPDDLMRRVINPNKYYLPRNGSLGSYEERGFLQLQTDRAAAKALYESTHVDRFAVSDAYSLMSRDFNSGGNAQAFGKGIMRNVDGGAIVYRTAGQSSAREAYDKLLTDPDTRSTPKNLPNSKCKQLPDNGYYRQFTCAIQYRNYVAVTWSRQLDDAQQRAAAEYALLANSEWM